MCVLLSFVYSLKDEKEKAVKKHEEFLDSTCPRRFKGSDFDQEVCRLACHTLANSIAQGWVSGELTGVVLLKRSGKKEMDMK